MHEFLIFLRKDPVLFCVSIRCIATEIPHRQVGNLWFFPVEGMFYVICIYRITYNESPSLVKPIRGGK